MFIRVPDFGKVTISLRNLCILAWTTGNVDCLVREVSQIGLCTNSFSREWIYSHASLNDGDTF